MKAEAEYPAIYQPSLWQQRFHALNRMGVNEALGAGSAGPGKSLALLMDIADQIAIEHERCSNPKHPHHIAWGQSKGWALHLRRTRLQLEQTIKNSHKLFKALDPGATWNEQKSTWTFTSGFSYQFGHCKDPNDWESYMSSEFTAIYWDELTAFLEEQYDQICTRLRSTDPVLSKMLRIRAMSNPLMRQEGGEKVVIKDPHWVRRRFVDKAPQGNVLFKKKLVGHDGVVSYHKWIYLPARLTDNPNKEFVKQYELQLLKSKPHIRQALLEGDWYVTVGSFFAEYWNKSLHVCKPFKIPSDWRVFRSMDWGFKAPGCIHWFALDDEGTLWLFKELRFQGKTDEEVAAMVKAVEESYDLWDSKRKSSRITGPADTQLWEQRGGAGKNMGQVFADKGVPWTKADKKSRQTNAGHVIKRLEDHDSGTKTPALVIFDTCKWIIQVLPSIQTSQHNSEEPQDGGDDHPYDCVDGSTRVTTVRGSVRIDELAPGELVLSTDGCFYPCSAPRLVHRGAETLRVEVGERVLFATPNHRVLCADGIWRRVDQLRTGMYAYAPWIREWSAQQSRSSMGPGTTSADSISKETVGDCIERFGSAQTVGRYPKGSMSTTGMRTERTMPARTSNLSKGASITGSITLGGIMTSCARWLRRGVSLLRSGIGALKASAGTESTRRCQSSGTEGNLRLPSAQFVEQICSTEAAMALASTALQHATRNSVAALESTTRNEYALPAGSTTWLAGSRVKPPVHGRAVRIGSVTEDDPRDVWCLGVPGMGAFVAEGVVVSNSLAYGCAFASRGKAAIPPKLEPKSEWDDEDEDDAPTKQRRGRHGYGQELC